MNMKFRVALCLALLFSTLPAAARAAGAAQDEAEALLRRGVELEQAGRFQEALDLYLQVLRARPGAEGVYTLVGNAQVGLGRLEEGLASYRRAARHDASDAGARYGAGNALYQMRRFAEAAEEYRAAARVRPDLPDGFASLSSTYYNLDRYDEAIAAAREAVRVKPDFAVGYVNLSWYYSMTDQHRESLDAARRGAELDPSNQMAHTNMCRAYNDLGQFAAAAAACERALQLKPEDGETLYYLGIARKGLKRPAPELFTRALAGLVAAESPEVDFTYLAGAAYSQLGRHGEAVAAFKRVLAERPDFIKARYNLAVSYVLLGERRAALAEQRELRRRSPEKAAKLDALLAETAPGRSQR
ncbi:MAG: tetratricopeptide repeat protein [Acidobacteriota bacterium]|nr:tetratricopeptide repeat protein [Acidobacteriota bacterium]